MATICPFADWRPLPEAESQPKITPRVVVYHTAVGTLRGVERFFRDSTSIESHLMVGGPWDGPDLDGALWQWMDLHRRADANRDANAFAISVESSDNAPADPADIAPWSDKQLAMLVRFGNWAADTFAIPRRQCPAWDAAGFGWHAMWGAPSHWTPSAGKVCPGPVRIRQLKEIVFPAIFAGANLEDDMYDADAEKRLFQRIEEAERRTARYVDHGDAAVTGSGNHHVKVREDVATIKAEVAQLAAQVAELAELVKGIALGRLEGDFDVSGIVHATSTLPPPPPVADIDTGGQL